MYLRGFPCPPEKRHPFGYCLHGRNLRGLDIMDCASTGFRHRPRAFGFRFKEDEVLAPTARGAKSMTTSRQTRQLSWLLQIGAMLLGQGDAGQGKNESAAGNVRRRVEPKKSACGRFPTAWAQSGKEVATVCLPVVVPSGCALNSHRETVRNRVKTIEIREAPSPWIPRRGA